MAGTPLFTVIVTTHNRPGLLRDALDSIRRQTVQDYECIVANDGETSVELPADDRFALMDERTGMGTAAAVNKALGRAAGRYLAFLDDDDAFTERRLELALDGLEIAPLAICWRANYDTKVAGRNRRLQGWVHDEILDRSPPMLGQTAVVRERMLPMDERLLHAQDVEWWIRATKELPVATIPEIGLLFRRHPGRQSADPEIRYSQRSLLYEIHLEYFQSHRRAATRFHARTGLFAHASGHARDARSHLWRALRLSPNLKTAYWLVRSTISRK